VKSPEVEDLFEGLAWPQAMEASIRFVVSNNSGKLPAVVHGPHAKRVSAAVVDDNIVAFGNVHWERYAAIQVISRKTERSSDTIA